MATIGAFEAKTHLSQLLDRVALGEKITITRHGRAVAVLGPPPQVQGGSVRRLVKEMLEIRDREGPTLAGKATIRELIEEGRRH